MYELDTEESSLCEPCTIAIETIGVHLGKLAYHSVPKYEEFRFDIMAVEVMVLRVRAGPSGIFFY